MARVVPMKSVKESLLDAYRALGISIAKEYSLEDTISQDCTAWEQINNKNTMNNEYLYLEKYEDSEDTGLYYLILNGGKLWYGTLQEINAIVKTMCCRLEKNDFLEQD